MKVREKQILYVLSAIEGALGKSRANTGLISEFKAQLTSEVNGWLPASATELNKFYDKLITGLPGRSEKLEPSSLNLSSVRPNTPKISLGSKYGKFCWQYTGIKDIKDLNDVAKLTGLSLNYLNELIGSEGERESMYKCSSNDRTIGIGHNFEHAVQAEQDYLSTTKLTKAERCQILAYDLTRAIQRLQSKNVDTTKLTQGQYEALVDVSFNAPAYMNSLTEKTIEALKLKPTNPTKARKLLDEAAYEFNQQFSNKKITPGLCKRRIQNLMRFMGVKKYSELPKNSKAKVRLEILALNGYKNSSFFNEGRYKTNVCNLLGITTSEFDKLKYPADYPQAN